MCSLINKQLLLTAYAYLSIMEQQKGQQGGGALQLQAQQQSGWVDEMKAWLPRNLFFCSGWPGSEEWFFQDNKEFDGTAESFENLCDGSKDKVRRRLKVCADNGTTIIVDTMELLLKLRKNDGKGEAALNAFLTARTKEKYDSETIEAVIQGDMFSTIQTDFRRAVGNLSWPIQRYVVPQAAELLQNMVTHFLDTSNFKSSFTFMELLLKLRKDDAEDEKLAALGTFLTARAEGKYDPKTIVAVIQADKEAVGALFSTNFVDFEVPEAAALLQGMVTHFLNTMELLSKLSKKGQEAEREKLPALRTFLTAMAEDRYGPETIEAAIQADKGAVGVLFSTNFVKLGVPGAVALLQNMVTHFLRKMDEHKASFPKAEKKRDEKLQEPNQKKLRCQKK